MPKVNIEFNLPDEQDDYELHTRAAEFHTALYDLDQTLRAALKYGHNYTSIEDALERLRDELHDSLYKAL